jgi:microcystin-dependent protein
MWSGTSPPSGWGICDGRTYRRVQDGTAVTTPDLRGRFILGYCPETIPSIDGSTVLLSKNVIQQTGGEEKHTLLGSEIPSHTHTYSNWRVAGQYNSYKRTVRNGTEDSYTLLDVNNNNPSEPTQTTSSSGEGKAHNNMPPYYVLAYIMKI